MTDDKLEKFREETIQVGDSVLPRDARKGNTIFKVIATTADTVTLEWRDANNIKLSATSPRADYIKVHKLPEAALEAYDNAVAAPDDPEPTA